MNILTKSHKSLNNMIIIDKNILEDIKKNKIKSEFLKRCLDYSKLMKGNER